MTTKEWKKVARILKESYKEVEAEAISKGIDIFSDEYKELIDVVREKVLTKLGFTIEEYREMADEVATARKKEVNKKIEEVTERIDNLPNFNIPKIPTREEIEEIAHEVAKEYIKPPQITNEIVKETTHEVKIEQPKIIETVRVENRVEKYDDKKLLKELAKLESKIAEIVIPDEEKIRNDLKFELQKNIDTLGMPDFRKLGMGLQVQIDEVRNSTPTGGGHTIQDEGVTLTQRTKLNFVGAGVTTTDDAGNDATVVTINGGGSVDGSGTANELSYWVDTDTLGSLAVATYPSLTELSYVKGVTSAIQTQLGTKDRKSTRLNSSHRL